MTLYVRTADALSTEVGSDFVALDIHRGECFGLSDVTADIWRLLERPLSLDDLCAELQAMYDVDAVTCRQDVAALIGEMQVKGLISPHRSR